MRAPLLPARLPHVLALLVLLAPALAEAQKPPPPDARQDQARARAQEGLKLFGADRWTEALAAFRESEGLFHAPSVALYIARCQRKLGKLLDARATYDHLLAEELPKDASQPFVQAHLDAGRELEALKARIPTLQVVVAGVPAGEAQMTLDGAPIGVEKRELDPGTYTLQVRTRTFPPLSRTVALAEGSHETVTVDVRPGAVQQPPPLPPSRVPAFVSFGVGGAGLVVGAALGGLVLKEGSAIRAACGSGPTCQDASQQSALSAARTKAWVADAGFFVAIAGAAVGTVLLFIGPSPSKQRVIQGMLGPGGPALRF